MKITTRPATEDDRDFARDGHHRGYRETVIRQFGEWDEGRQDRFFDDGWAAAKHDILLCDGEPCGYVSIIQLPEYTHVREFLVHPDWQRRGIGSAYLRQVIATAEKRNVPVKLGVLRENSAIDFYRKLGFEEFDRTETHIIMERGANSALKHDAEDGAA